MYHAYSTVNGFGTPLPCSFNPFHIRLGTVRPAIVFHHVRNAIIYIFFYKHKAIIYDMIARRRKR